ncbi:MAG: 3-dehydroquinate synthase [Saprospiraceae bacterium]|nr:MAG: 3-dehydroquinate synthase [Saprospiraceae bacterium]
MFLLHLNDYDISIGSPGGFDGEALRQLVRKGSYTKIALLTDENTKRHCLPLVLPALDFEINVIEIPSGEQHKSLDTCNFVWQEMVRIGLDRRSLLINLGGGVIGDMGGFCAATYLRGIDFVQMPATLLAQVDASIGGKLGIDFQYLKNNIGVFKNPKAVFVEPVFLKTLPARQIRSGFAEIIKHALIGDAGLWEQLQSITDLSTVDWAALLAPSLAIKKRVVEEDPHEKGIRKALNFGHTIGHAVESFSFKNEKPLLHGEAVAVGMICETFLSHKLAGLPLASVESVTQFILRFYEPYPLDEKGFPELLSLMKMDKKNVGGRINFTLINPLGQAIIDQSCEEALIEESLRFYLELGS